MTVVGRVSTLSGCVSREEAGGGRTYTVVTPSITSVTLVVCVLTTTLVAVAPLTVFVAGTLAVPGAMERQLHTLDKLELAFGPFRPFRQASEVAGLLFLSLLRARLPGAD